MRSSLKWILPLVVVVVAAGMAYAMYLSRPDVEIRPPREVIPLVRVENITLRDMVLTVTSQGTVSPRTESSLVPEVAGRVVEVAPSFETGGFFAADQVLLRIDPHDYEQAVVSARARVATADLRLAREQAEARVAADEWRDLGREDQPPSPLTLRIPQMAEAEAALAAAHADLGQAERNLERTVIRALFAGRVRTKNVDVGQYVTPGVVLATLYAVDVAEVRLPLPDKDLAYVDLPLVYRGEADDDSYPGVTLRADFAGRTFAWEGRIVRTEGEIDRRSRMVTAVAQVKDPYDRGDDPRRPPLAVGMFVQAEIQGHHVTGVAVIPRAALRGESQVLIVDDGDRLRFRDVSVLRRSGDIVIIDGGLQDGDRLCLSSLLAVTDGMQVRVDQPS
ncbi:MAG: efflux RND transporter periplasmic adaptor subunit [Acidobacteria bacterium]|nr:efflux RND transporter periplasmic adaptor subunit [Acidobacteriota bacterium]